MLKTEEYVDFAVFGRQKWIVTSTLFRHIRLVSLHGDFDTWKCTFILSLFP